MRMTVVKGGDVNAVEIGYDGGCADCDSSSDLEVLKVFIFIFEDEDTL